jgi:hypothetical protein
MTKILGFDDFVPSTQPSTREPRPGLFASATPEHLRELAERQKLLDYLTLRAADMFEPEQDLLH